MTASVTASTAFSSGATATSYTNVLATILGQKFDYIVPHCVDTTAIDAIKTQITTQALPATGYRQKVINGQCISASSAATLASGRNHERMDFALSSSRCYVLGAAFAAVRVLQSPIIVQPTDTAPRAAHHSDSSTLEEGAGSRTRNSTRCKAGGPRRRRLAREPIHRAVGTRAASMGRP